MIYGLLPGFGSGINSPCHPAGRWCVPPDFFVVCATNRANGPGSFPGQQKEVTPIAKATPDKVRVNEMIRARQIRVIDENGEQLGIMTPYEARREAESRGLDLVEVADKAIPPVCRIMDYGKFRYQQSKRAKEARKNQHQITVKEIKYRPKIDPHDFTFKTEHVREFLRGGDKVKVTIMFRGREMAHPEFGREILQRVVEATKDLGQADIDPVRSRIEGRNMSIVITALRQPTPVQTSATASPSEGMPPGPLPGIDPAVIGSNNL